MKIKYLRRGKNLGPGTRQPWMCGKSTGERRSHHRNGRCRSSADLNWLGFWIGDRSRPNVSLPDRGCLRQIGADRKDAGRPRKSKEILAGLQGTVGNA